MKEAMQAGLKIGVCTTSNEQAAKAITEKILSDIKFDLVLAGDVVSKRSPIRRSTTWRFPSWV